MLQLKNIVKIYKTDFSEQTALKGLTITFKPGEFVSILGPSGCGKTTLLNIIGGLDRYTEGDLIINGKSTKDFTSSDWDAYRNNSVGFVFQNYNLIHHISILENVEMGMTLSGISQSERRERALDVLKKVGLEHHLNKKPSQLSGGQKQRVAIARALANNPDIILADEPTGALDSTTSHEVMELIKEISKEKLVIMVTHNQEIANQYSTRIVKLLDGEMIDDTKPTNDREIKNTYNPNRTAMSFITALKLSFNNLKTKKVRTMITAFAGSIGIIGISLVLSISNGFSQNITDLEQNTFSGFPLTINRYKSIDMNERMENRLNRETVESDELTPYDPSARSNHENLFTDEYLNYLKSMDASLYSSIQYVYGVNLTLLVKNNEVVTTVSRGSIGWNTLYEDDEFTKSQYDVVYGRLPENYNEIVLVTDSRNRINQRVLQAFGFDVNKSISYSDILNKQLVVGKNDDIYVKVDEVYKVNNDLNAAYTNGEVLTIVGVLKGKPDGLQSNNRGIYYKASLTEEIFKQSENSEICIAQSSSKRNVLTNQPFETSSETKKSVEQALGCNSLPTSISIYPKNTDSKDRIKSYLDNYNVGKEETNQILYDDLSETITSMLGTMINMISAVLVAFAAISLVVSSIMIGIITYVSVLERTKEIGILRSLGARKKDISRVFNAETVIIGLVAGILGIVITFLLSFPINLIVNRFVDELNNVVRLSLIQSLFLIIISIVLTFISGLIPSRIAANKNPVEALRHNE